MLFSSKDNYAEIATIFFVSVLSSPVFVDVHKQFLQAAHKRDIYPPHAGLLVCRQAVNIRLQKPVFVFREY